MMSALIFAATLAAAACQGPFTADAHHIGPVVLNQSVAALKTSSLDIDRTMVTDDCCDHPHYVVTVCPGLDIDADADERDRTLVSLSTASSGFTTRKGAHVGMTVRELKALYPNGNLTYGKGEGLYATFVIASGLYFSLDQDGIPDKCYENDAKCDALFLDRRAVELDVR